MAHELVLAFDLGLRVRPGDFVANTHDSDNIYTLTDKASGVEWWVANRAYGLHATVVDEENSHLSQRVNFGFWDRRRAWRAFKEWRRDHFRPGPTRVERATIRARQANARVGAA